MLLFFLYLNIFSDSVYNCSQEAMARQKLWYWWCPDLLFYILNEIRLLRKMILGLRQENDTMCLSDPVFCTCRKVFKDQFCQEDSLKGFLLASLLQFEPYKEILKHQIYKNPWVHNDNNKTFKNIKGMLILHPRRLKYKIMK